MMPASKPNPRRASIARSARSRTGSTGAVGPYDDQDVGASERSTQRSTTTRASTGRCTRAATSTTTGPLKDQQIICALTESRAISPTVGLALVNLSTAEAVLCQIADNQTYVKTLHKLHVFDPSEIVFATIAGGVQKSKLLQVLEANLTGGAPVRALHRKYWDEAAGIAYVENLAFTEDVQAIKVSIEGNCYATSCFAAAMKYIETVMNLSFAFHSMRIKYEPSEGAMLIDVATIQALELTQNAQNPRSPHSLFGLLHQTLTRMGTRLLRSSILQPLIHREIIEKRYDAVEELTTSIEVFVAVRRALKGFEDVDRTLTNIVIIDERPSVRQWEQSINNVLAIKHYVRAVPAVYKALHHSQSELLMSIRALCAPSGLSVVGCLIDEAINSDVTYQKQPIQLRNQRIYAVKAGINGILDIARQTYKEAGHDAYQLMLELQQSYEINLELKHDTPRQNYFVIHVSELTDRALPEIFINAVRKRNVIECQTLTLMKLNQKIVDSANEVMRLSDGVIQSLIVSIRATIAPLFRISDGIAVLDLLGAFAQVASSQGYTRPEFTPSTLAIKGGRHPVAEKLCSERFVPNDVYATATKRLHLVTGCNMSGKSTYIRSIALLTIMAQIGCFVPAQYAAFHIRHQLFARVSIDDNAASNVSTFAAEMRETAFILRNISPESLVIVDELGRGTSTRDGLAIAIAVAEALVQSRALIWFVTHFRDLPAVLAEREGVAALHLRTSRPNANSLAMLYEVADGPVEEPHYGLALARAVNLPDDALAIATDVAHQLEARALHRRKFPALEVLQARRRRLVLGLREQLVQARDGDLQGAELRAWLKELQDEFVRRMCAIDADEERVRAHRYGRGGDASPTPASLSVHLLSTNNALQPLPQDAHAPGLVENFNFGSTIARRLADEGLQKSAARPLLRASQTRSTPSLTTSAKNASNLWLSGGGDGGAQCPPSAHSIASSATLIGEAEGGGEAAESARGDFFRSGDIDEEPAFFKGLDRRSLDDDGHDHDSGYDNDEDEVELGELNEGDYIDDDEMLDTYLDWPGEASNGANGEDMLLEDTGGGEPLMRGAKRA